MQLNMSKIVLAGSDTSYFPQNASYVTFILTTDSNKIAKKTLENCIKIVECADQMLDPELLRFAQRKNVI